MMALRTSIVENTDTELLIAAYRKKYRPTVATYDALPAGLHLTVLAVTTDVRLSATQMDQLQTAIEGIAGVNVCRVLSQGPPNGVGTPPAGHQVNLSVETAFTVTPAPV